uniref:Bardet-Biedl syndrome 2 protein n=1 Tax=Cacopsylla melanoneura TaxID=428564 RepID=A0A8D9F590_9HEMI
MGKYEVTIHPVYNLILDYKLILYVNYFYLLMELRNYNTVTDNTGIPANTRLMTEVTSSPPSSNEEKGYVLLKLSTNNLTVLRLATIFAEGIFGGETLVVCPSVDKINNRLSIQLVPPKETPLDVHIKAFVGVSPKCDQFHVFELTKQLPQFSMFIITSCTPPDDMVKSNYVNFALNERAQRIEMWLCQKFIIPPMMSGRTIEKKNRWFVALKSLRDSSNLLLSYEDNTMHIETSNIHLAADIVLSITEYLNIDQLQTQVEIPSIFEQIETRMNNMQELEQNSSKITSYVANNARTIRSLTVQAEDSRLLGNMKEMRDFYIQLKQQNEEVIQNYKVRCSEHEQYLDNLRHINNIIQQAARLRVGSYKTELIQKCRTALMNLNAKSLIKIIQTGSE